ncbi:hypothetical protein [Aliidiomarina haloalkalitolerans]|uniref:CopL family metal-binding regulatory protein n=1 Tax=Aliidiomarina haloalkalitolerans TaxID=859059 RepID=A0A432VSY8_9GAMM|nr:hypothetical protein [Aliidiomarina haloalkalitolerans]RUO19514.1 hypothetical protein CWE06_08265 [Aliidiomarina haloalkalitolerans]
MRTNGRLWLVIFILSTLVTLPFAGGATAYGNTHTTGIQHLAHGMTTSDTVHSALAPSEKADAHCELMAKMQEQVAHTAVAHAAPDHTSHSADSNHDCCDQGSDCYLNCPADCGHCVSAGHGCMAALVTLECHLPSPAHNVAWVVESFYSLLPAQNSRPPIIA